MPSVRAAVNSNSLIPHFIQFQQTATEIDEIAGLIEFDC